MKPGVHKDMSFEDYAKAEGLNQSKLKVMKRSPAKFKHLLQVSREDTEALGMGRAIHTAVLEPELFNQMFVQEPEVNKRTNEGKRLLAEFKELNGGKELLSPSDYNSVFEIASAVLSHPDAARLLEDTERELSVWWEDKATDVLCKARVDAWKPSIRTIVDLKTTRDAGPGFERSIYSYGYHMQAAWYNAALEAHGYEPHHFVIIAVEKEPPYDIGIYRLTDDVIELSKRENEALLRRYAECKRKDYWPGYTQGIVDVGLPKFAMDEMEERYGEPF